MLSCRNVPETFNLANEVVSAFSKTWRLTLTSDHLRISVNGVDQLKVTFADDCSPGWNSWDRQADSAQFNSIDSASKRYRVIAKEGSGSGSGESFYTVTRLNLKNQFLPFIIDCNAITSLSAKNFPCY